MSVCDDLLASSLHYVCSELSVNGIRKGQVMAMSVIIGGFFLAIAIGVGTWRERKAFAARPAH